MLSKHFILLSTLFLLPSVFPRAKVFSSELISIVTFVTIDLYLLFLYLFVILISLMINDVKCHICAAYICFGKIFRKKRKIFRSCAHVLIGLFVCLLLRFKSCLCILDTSPLSNKISKNCLPFCVCLLLS